MEQTKYLNKYEMVLEKISMVFAIIAALALTLMMLITAADVLLRIGNIAIFGSIEMVEYLMAVLVPLSVAYCEKKRQHICVELIVQHFPKKTQPWFDLITSAITLVLYFIVTYRCCLYVISCNNDNLTSSVLLVPVWPFVIPCVFGFLLTALLLINHCARVVTQIRHGHYGI